VPQSTTQPRVPYSLLSKAIIYEYMGNALRYSCRITWLHKGDVIELTVH
jgi:hypothetical protein